MSTGPSVQQESSPERSRALAGRPDRSELGSTGAPSQRVVVTVAPALQIWELELVDLDDPLLVFDAESGRLIPPRNTLPRGRVWIAYPGRTTPEPARRLEADVKVAVIERPELPHGWDGWSFVGRRP